MQLCNGRRCASRDSTNKNALSVEWFSRLERAVFRGICGEIFTLFQVCVVISTLYPRGKLLEHYIFILLCSSQSNLTESDYVRHVLSMIPALLTLAGSLVILFLRLPSCSSRRDRRYTHIMQLKAFPIISNWEYIFSVKLRDKEEMKLARKPSLVRAPDRSLPMHSSRIKRKKSNWSCSPKQFALPFPS